MALPMRIAKIRRTKNVQTRRANQRMAANRRGVSRKVLINSFLLLLFLLAAIVLFFLLRESAPPLLDATFRSGGGAVAIEAPGGTFLP